ncbi:hypothetical protein HWV62_43531, partial [Athelia sp. TMB]
VVMPAELGHLSHLIGIPAGGSVTANQWLLLATVVGPIAASTGQLLVISNIPQLWHDYMPVDLERQKKQQAAKIETHSSKKSKKAQRQSQKWQEKKATNAAKKAAAKAVNMSTTAQAAAAVDTAADTLESSGPSGPDEPGRSADGAQGKAPNHKCKCRKQHLTDDEDSDDKGAASRLHPDDPDNFVKLSTALCLLLSCEITEDVIDMADELIREYCTELIDVRCNCAPAHV